MNVASKSHKARNLLLPVSLLVKVHLIKEACRRSHPTRLTSSLLRAEAGDGRNSGGPPLFLAGPRWPSAVPSRIYVSDMSSLCPTANGGRADFPRHVTAS